jgi:hypothetical protein
MHVRIMQGDCVTQDLKGFHRMHVRIMQGNCIA